jgi:lysozyme family protein
LLDEGVKPDDSRLLDATIGFYSGAFWLPLRCGDMSYRIACEVFDTAIHTSKREAASMFQLSLNILNRQEYLYDDVVADGHIGNQTMVAYRLLLKEEPDEVNLFKTLNVMQGAHYVATVRKLPRQEMNYRGWLTRVVFTHDGRTS